MSLKRQSENIRGPGRLFGKKVESGYAAEYYDPKYTLVHNKEDRANLHFGKKDHSIKYRHQVGDI